jgi:two-component system chemotaxis response regulator CheB
MPGHDIIVIGGSAGSITALSAVVRELPADLPAAVFIVVHVPSYGISRLPDVLSRAGPLPALHAVDGMPVRSGQIVIAPPDRHMVLRHGLVTLSRGPRENHTRPAIDPLFRSAARAYGPHVIGIVLSGALYDGSLGLMAVQMRGGIAIVQDPREAAVESMPRNALKLVAADYVLPAAEIGSMVVDLVSSPAEAKGVAQMADADERMNGVIADDFAAQAENERVDETTIYTCPDCGGVMWQDGADQHLRFRCHVGHAYAPEIFLSQKAEEFEAALWTSLRLLKEKATLTRQLAARTRLGGNGKREELITRYEEQAQLNEQYVHIIQELLAAMPNPADPLTSARGETDLASERLMTGS